MNTPTFAPSADHPHIRQYRMGRAGAAIPAPWPVTGIGVVALGEQSGLAAQIHGQVRGDLGDAVVHREIVIDLRVGASVPARAVAANRDTEPLRARCMIADQVPAEVHQEPPKLLGVEALDDRGVRADLPRAIDADGP